MQLNTYVPKDRANLVEALDAEAKRTGRSKNDIVLDALEAYLQKKPLKWESHNLGLFEMPSRAEIYEEVIDRHFGPAR